MEPQLRFLKLTSLLAAIFIALITIPAFAGPPGTPAPKKPPAAGDAKKQPGTDAKKTEAAAQPGAAQPGAAQPGVTQPVTPQPVTPQPEAAPPGEAELPLSALSTARITAICKDNAARMRKGQAVDPAQKGRLKECLGTATGGFTAAPASVGTDLLQAVAQVVATRAQRAAWGILLAEIKKLAKCDDPTPAKVLFPATCKILDKANIQDLVSSPTPLLDAVVTDFLQKAKVGHGLPAAPAGSPLAAVSTVLLSGLVEEIAGRWRGGDVDGLVSALKDSIQQAVHTTLEDPKVCKDLKNATEIALWATGVCIAEQQTATPFDHCNVEGLLQTCDATTQADQVKAERRLLSLAARALKQKPAPSDVVELTFAFTDQVIDDLKVSAEATKSAHEYTAGLKVTVLGIVTSNWVQATTGAVTVIEIVLQGDDRESSKQLLSVLAAVGNYASTYNTSDNKDPATASAARQKIIDELVDRMTNRANRKSGTVVSLGGNLGLLGGGRTDFSTGTQVAFPVQLGLGLGLQTYADSCAKESKLPCGGFHMMLTALDVGQYVSFSKTGVSVATPEVGSAVTIGGTVGGWVTSPQNPFYLGGYFGASPFVRTNGNITYQFGAVTGVYVPLLDFN